MLYTTKLDVQNYLLTTIDVAFDSQLTSYITAMSEYIDSHVGYPVYRDTPSERLYDGSGRYSMQIDPVHTITAITVDGTAVTPVQQPYNNDVKRGLTLRNDTFPEDLANVSVTGIHSLRATLPEQIKWACTVLVALAVQQVDEQREGIQSEKIGDYSVTYQDQQQRGDLERAKEIIRSFRPVNF